MARRSWLPSQSADDQIRSGPEKMVRTRDFWPRSAVQSTVPLFSTATEKSGFSPFEYAAARDVRVSASWQVPPGTVPPVVVVPPRVPAVGVLPGAGALEPPVVVPPVVPPLVIPPVDVPPVVPAGLLAPPVVAPPVVPPAAPPETVVVAVPEATGWLAPPFFFEEPESEHA